MVEEGANWKLPNLYNPALIKSLFQGPNKRYWWPLDSWPLAEIESSNFAAFRPSFHLMTVADATEMRRSQPWHSPISAYNFRWF